jgi:integrase/recombinase XerD
VKVDGHGQAKILTLEEIQILFADGFLSSRDRALFGICLYTACRISEALALRAEDVQQHVITLRKSTTKGKQATRQIDIHPDLAVLLEAYDRPSQGFLFPGKRGLTECLTRSQAHNILREACYRVGLMGISTHSFRRTALTQMSAAGIPLRSIQEISGHANLQQLQKYLEVTPDQRREAIMSIASIF